MDYTTQMDAARKQIYTKEMKEVAKKENMDIGELCRLIAEGKAIIPCNKTTRASAPTESAPC